MIVGVTGVSGGIGTALEAQLTADGISVIGFARNPHPGHQTLDVTWDRETISATIAGAIAPSQLFDGWVNLAGADILQGDVRKLPYLSRLHLLWTTDVEGTIKCTQAVLPRLRPGGVIINIAWDEALTGAQGASAELYATAKAAIIGYSASLARSLAPTFRVGVIAPGWVKTRWAASLSPEQRERLIQQSRSQHWISADRVAGVIMEWLKAPGPSGTVVTVS
ncbi:MAG: SDR family NAD(P)-dependent oxidoreductase [Sulfobacillus thermotolerans]|nr:SDR family NAD(P)-dependent oxidoreductase [Sulfobacillus thermotolerans]